MHRHKIQKPNKKAKTFIQITFNEPKNAKFNLLSSLDYCNFNRNYFYQY